MRKILFILAAIFWVGVAHSQMQISGKIRSLKPITIVVEDINGNVILSHAIDKSGVFTAQVKEIKTDLYKIKIESSEIYMVLENKPFTINGFFNNQNTKASNLAMKGAELNNIYDVKNAEFCRNRDSALKSVTDFIASTPTLGEQIAMLATLYINNDYLNADYEQIATVLEKCQTVKNSIVYAKIEELKNAYYYFSPNAPAYNFTAQDVNGKKYSLSDFKGKMVLLDFWASWCGPCRAEMKSLHKIYEEIKGDDLQFISLSLDDTKEKWETALKTDNIPWLALWEGVTEMKSKHNPGFYDSVIRPKYGFKQIPFIVLIDKNGLTVKRFLRGEEVKTEIELLRKNNK